MSTAFPDDFIHQKSGLPNWILYALWLVIPLETWIAIWVGTASPEDLLALLALVFYKAIALIALTLIVFKFLPDLARQSPAMGRIAKRMANRDPGSLRIWAAALFLFWFSTSAIWWAASVVAWFLSHYGMLAPNDLVAAFINRIAGYDATQWYGKPITQSSMMIVVVSAIYSIIAYVMLLLTNAFATKDQRMHKNAGGPGPNGIAILLIVIIINAIFLMTIRETAYPT